MTKKGVYQVYDKFLEIWLRFSKSLYLCTLKNNHRENNHREN